MAKFFKKCNTSLTNLQAENARKNFAIDKVCKYGIIILEKGKTVTVMPKFLLF